MLELLTSFLSYYFMSEFTCLIVAGGSIILILVRIGYRQYEGCDNWRMPLTSSFYWPSSVSWWHAHIRALMLHTLHIGQIYTIPYPLISYRPLRCTHTFAPLRDSSFTSLCQSSPPSPSIVSTATSLHPTSSIPTCSHHRIPTRAPGSHATTIGVLGFILNISIRYSMASSQLLIKLCDPPVYVRWYWGR